MNITERNSLARGNLSKGRPQSGDVFMINGPRGVERKENLIVLNHQKQEALERVGQEDFEEFILLTQEFHEAEKRWRTKREEILSAISAGKPVEAGIHQAHLIRSTKLIVR